MTREGGGGLEVLEGLHLAWVREEDLPPGDAWLTPAEREVLAGLRLPKRRTDWLLGRWAAKRAVFSLLGAAGQGAPPSDIEVLATEEGSPLARCLAVGSGPGSIRLSISHAGGVGFAAAGEGGPPVGCDVEVVESRSEAFVADYLTPREAEAVRSAGPEGAALTANLIWSAKESALKALGEGLRLDTRTVEVELPPSPRRASPRDGLGVSAASWMPLSVARPGGGRFHGWWRAQAGLVWTVLRGS